MRPPQALVYCRAGFERECAQELASIATGMGVTGFVRARPASAYAVFEAHEEEKGRELAAHVEYRRLVFARQLVAALPILSPLPERDRASPIAAAARRLGREFADLWIEMPDTNEGKALSSLARTLRPHLEKALAREGVEIAQPRARERLHLFFTLGNACHVAAGEVANSAPWPMGIPRLRMPAAAPSRSALKLAEAFLHFVPEAARKGHLSPGMTAVDLGAAPGGWTWQLVQRGLMVTAVDNGPMDPALLDTGQVKHRRADGFSFEPPHPVDWMVCDMIESPARIARLAARWIGAGWCREAIFNLKLPMKERWETVLGCRDIIDEALGGGGYFLRIKHLYHDREEVTAYLARR